MEKGGKLYRALLPKETITRGMKLKYLTPTTMGELEILDILDAQGKEKEKADCNSDSVFLQTSLSDLPPWTLLYADPQL